MANRPTKYYSSKQENMIADYLDWSVVVASGARAFHPGDVKSEEFLGECKTHTEQLDTIYMFFDVWNKIVSESASVFRRPVLFLDNGTQSANDTWCILHKRFIPLGTSILLSDLQQLKTTTRAVTFSHLYLKDNIEYMQGMTFKIPDDSGALVIMRLNTFKSLFGGDYF